MPHNKQLNSEQLHGAAEHVQEMGCNDCPEDESPPLTYAICNIDFSGKYELRKTTSLKDAVGIVVKVFDNNQIWLSHLCLRAIEAIASQRPLNKGLSMDRYIDSNHKN